MIEPNLELQEEIFLIALEAVDSREFTQFLLATVCNKLKVYFLQIKKPEVIEIYIPLRDKILSEVSKVPFPDQLAYVKQLEMEILSLLPYKETELGSVPLEDLYPTTVGKYQLIKSLESQGGMSKVFLAEKVYGEEHKKSIQKAVVKFILSGAIYEDRLMAKLNSDSIVKIYDSGKTKLGIPYIVMEYVDGQPIDIYCNAQRSTFKERLELFYKVCVVIQYAHQNMIIHRDIKPSNILVTAGKIVKLLDFGIAKELNHSSITKTATQTQSRFATPLYASPEQLTGDPTNALSDVYSLGVLLYQLLTGHLPYHINKNEGNIEDLRKEILSGERIKPSQAVLKTETSFVSRAIDETPQKLSKKLRGDLEVIILTAINVDPTRRYGSVEAFSNDITNFLNGLPIKARRDSSFYVFSKYIQRNRWQVGAISVLLLAILSGAGATFWQAHQAEIARGVAEQRFQDVHNLANSFIYDTYDQIADLQGSTKAKEKLVKTALEYLDKLSKDAETDTTLLKDLAFAYQKIASVLDTPFGASLERTPEAIDSYNKSISIFEKLLLKQPNDLKVREGLSDSYTKLGFIYVVRISPTEALKFLNKGLLHSQYLIEKDGKNIRYLELLSQTYLYIADACETSSTDVKKAITYRKKTVDACNKWLELAPNSTQAKYRLTLVYGRMGNHSVFTLEQAAAIGDRELVQMCLEQALEGRQKTLSFIQELFQKEPENARFKRFLGSTYDDLGYVQRKLKDYKKSVYYYEESINILKEIANKDTKNIGIKIDLVRAYLNKGSALVEGNDISEGFKYIDIAKKIVIQEIPDNAYNSVTKLRISPIILAESKALAKLNRIKEAIDLLRSCPSIYTLTNDNPDIHTLPTYYGGILIGEGHTLNKLIELLVKNKKEEEAKEISLKAISAMSKEADKTNAPYEASLSIATFLLTCPYKSLQDPKKAIDYLNKAIRSKNPDRSFIATISAIAYYKLGDKTQSDVEVQKIADLFPITTSFESDVLLDRKIKPDFSVY